MYECRSSSSSMYYVFDSICRLKLAFNWFTTTDDSVSARVVVRENWLTAQCQHLSDESAIHHVTKIRVIANDLLKDVFGALKFGAKLVSKGGESPNFSLEAQSFDEWFDQMKRNFKRKLRYASIRFEGVLHTRMLNTELPAEITIDESCDISLLFNSQLHTYVFVLDYCLWNGEETCKWLRDASTQHVVIGVRVFVRSLGLLTCRIASLDIPERKVILWLSQQPKSVIDSFVRFACQK